MATVIDSLLITLGFDADTSGAASFDTGLGKIIKTAGKVAAAVGAAAGAVGALTVNTAANFEEAMNAISAVNGAAGDEFDALRESAKKLGAETAYSATEAANGMEFLAKAGLTTQQVLETIPNALSLAAAGGIDLASSADILSNIMSGMGIAANESGRAADVLARAAASSNVDVSMIGESMKYVAPIAKQLGVTLEETSAIIGVLGNAGIQASQAGTSLRAMFTRFNTHKSATKSFDELGISLQDANGDMRSMIDVMKDLSIATADMDPDEKLDYFKDMAGVEAMSALAVAVDAAADGSLQNLNDKLGDATGAAEDMAAVRMEGFKGEMKQLKSALEGLLIDLADTGILTAATNGIKLLTKGVGKLVEYLPAVAETVGGFFQYFEDNAQRMINTLKVVGIIAGVIAGSLVLMYAPAIAGFILMRAIALTSFLIMKAAAISSAIATGAAWAIAFAPFLLVGAAIAAVVAAMWFLWSNWDEIWTKIKSGAQVVIDYIADALSPIIDSVKWLLNKIPGINISDKDSESTHTINREWSEDDDRDDSQQETSYVLRPAAGYGSEQAIDYGSEQQINYGPNTNYRPETNADYAQKPDIDYGAVVDHVSKLAVDYGTKAIDYSQKAIATSPSAVNATSSNFIDYSKHSVNNNSTSQAQSTVTQTIHVSSANEAAIIAERTAQSTRQQSNGYQ